MSIFTGFMSVLRRAFGKRGVKKKKKHRKSNLPTECTCYTVSLNVVQQPNSDRFGKLWNRARSNGASDDDVAHKAAEKIRRQVCWPQKCFACFSEYQLASMDYALECEYSTEFMLNYNTTTSTKTKVEPVSIRVCHSCLSKWKPTMSLVLNAPQGHEQAITSVEDLLIPPYCTFAEQKINLYGSSFISGADIILRQNYVVSGYNKLYIDELYRLNQNDWQAQFTRETGDLWPHLQKLGERYDEYQVEL